jgi:hypothetical protein
VNLVERIAVPRWVQETTVVERFVFEPWESRRLSLRLSVVAIMRKILILIMLRSVILFASILQARLRIVHDLASLPAITISAKESTERQIHARDVGMSWGAIGVDDDGLMTNAASVQPSFFHAILVLLSAKW